MEKMQFSFENILGKFLRFGRMHEKNIFFFVFEKGNRFKSF